jgi:hypothetical protein
MIKLTILILFILQSAWAAETCSRVATINYQEVLVDVSSKNLGEGLRYYLEKDPLSKDLLNEYQANSQTTWKSAAMSSVGTVLILGGLLNTGGGGKSENFLQKNAFLLGGLTLIAASYLISKNDEINNEHLLSQSIEEYNKRNTPKIFFSPTDPRNGLGGAAGIGQEF